MWKPKPKTKYEANSANETSDNISHTIVYTHSRTHYRAARRCAKQDFCGIAWHKPSVYFEA